MPGGWRWIQLPASIRPVSRSGFVFVELFLTGCVHIGPLVSSNSVIPCFGDTGSKS